jgi:hypothetical protein
MDDDRQYKALRFEYGTIKVIFSGFYKNRKLAFTGRKLIIASGSTHYRVLLPVQVL